MHCRAPVLLTFLAAPALSTQLKPVSAPSAADRANVERLERSLAHDSMEGRGLAAGDTLDPVAAQGARGGGGRGAAGR